MQHRARNPGAVHPDRRSRRNLSRQERSGEDSQLVRAGRDRALNADLAVSDRAVIRDRREIPQDRTAERAVPASRPRKGSRGSNVSGESGNPGALAYATGEASHEILSPDVPVT